jgi:hypothetical protein
LASCAVCNLLKKSTPRPVYLYYTAVERYGGGEAVPPRNSLGHVLPRIFQVN